MFSTLRHAVLLCSLCVLLGACTDADIPLGNETPPVVGYVEMLTPRACGAPLEQSRNDVYAWHKLDGADAPAEVRWILLSTEAFGSYDATAVHIRENPADPNWSAWTTYAASSRSMSWTSPEMDHGEYVFAVHGRDAAGVSSDDFTFDRNMLRVVVNGDEHGPVVTVYAFNSDHPLEPSQPLVVPAGETFLCWSGDASAYCGEVVSYRHSWAPTTDWVPYDGSRVCSPRIIVSEPLTLFELDVRDAQGHVTSVTVRVVVNS